MDIEHLRKWARQVKKDAIVKQIKKWIDSECAEFGSGAPLVGWTDEQLATFDSFEEAQEHCRFAWASWER